MPSQYNTYRKLDRDTAFNKVDKESMYDCRNFRLLGSDPNESGALVNMHGNYQLQGSFPGYASDSVIGSVQLRDITILITTDFAGADPTGQAGRIWKWDFRNWTAPVLIYNGALELSKMYPINENIVTRYESEDLQKVYWADGYNKLRYANIADPDIGTLDPDDFNIVNEVDFEAPVFEEILAGKIPVGRIQYAYRLYKRYGPQTMFSPASRMINLTIENESASNTLSYGGADRLDEDGEAQSSGKAIKISISNVDQNFDKIEVIAIHYSDINEAPNIYIVQTTDVADTIYITDSGVYEQGFYTLSEYTALSNVFIPKTLATKNNILFAGDIETQEFDVDYDARAYRWRSTSQGFVFDSSGAYYYMVGLSSIFAFNGAPPVSSIADIPETFDCFQIGNNILSDPGANLDQWQSGGSGGTRGGEGVNVSYEFKDSDYYIDISHNDQTFYVDGEAAPYYWRSGASPYRAGYELSYQRDEIYRFGIVFFSAQGQPSPVKWIGDIRMPRAEHMIGGNDARHSSSIFGNHLGKSIYIEFTINNIPTEAAGFQIVRVERKPEDRTVLFQSKMSFFGALPSSTGHFISRPDDAKASDYEAIRLASGTSDNRLRLLWLSSPEVSFYKDYKAASNDYIEIVGYYDTKAKTSTPPPPYGRAVHHVNKYYDYNPLAYSADLRRNVSEGFTQEVAQTPDQQIENHAIGGLQYFNAVYSNTTGTIDMAEAGTAAIAEIGSSFILSSLPGSSWPVANYRRPVVQYGGNTYEARVINKYIPASEYIPKTGSNMTIDCFGGDTHVQFFDHLHGFWNGYYAQEDLPEFDPHVYVDMFPVESTINLDLRHDDCWHRLYNGADTKYYLREVGNAVMEINNVEYNPGYTDYYLYNTVFSRMENARLYFPVSADYNLNQHNDSLVMASNAKLNNEEIDSWTIWASDETLPLDGGFGPIKYLVSWNNALLFFQEKGFGTLSVLDRSLIQDSQGRNLTLGEGDVLQRYDMISTEAGVSTRSSLVVTPGSILFYDNKNRRMYRLSKDIENLGVIKGMNSYFKSIADTIGEGDNPLVTPYRGFAMGYNSKFNEIWFSIKTGNADGETLVYNEILDSFTLFIDNNYVTRYINQDDILISQRLNGDIYQENSEVPARGSFYGSIKDAVVSVIMNPANTLVHKLTNIELTTEVYDNSDNNLLGETITDIRVTNDYQDTGVLTLVPGTNIRRLLRTWRMNALRDSGNRARLRDTYHKVQMSFTNNNPSPRKVVIHDLLTVFEVQNEAVVNKQ